MDLDQIEEASDRMISGCRKAGLVKADINRLALYYPPMELDDDDLPEFQRIVAEKLHAGR